MRQRISHHRAVLGVLNRQPAIGMIPQILRRAPYPERYLHLVACQAIIDVRPMHATIHIGLAVEDLLTVIGHIDHHSVLIGKALGDGIEDRVVVSERIVVFSEDALLLVSQFRAVIHRRCEVGERLARITGPIVDMRTHQVENHEVSLTLPIGLRTLIIGLQETLVKTVGLGVTNIKLPLAQFRIVQEEVAAEVVDGLLRLGQELVGDKRYVIASLAEHLWEKRLVAPLATIADGIERQHVLEDKARQIPRGHHIGKRNERTIFGHHHLIGCCLFLIAVELGVMLVVALANHQHDVGHAIAAAVHLNQSAGSLQLYYLLGSQTVDIDTKGQAIDGDIEFGLILTGQFVLHLSDGIAGEEPVHRHLIIPCLADGAEEHPGHDAAHDGFEASDEALVDLWQNHPLVHLAEIKPDDSPEEVRKYQQQNPAHA